MRLPVVNAIWIGPELGEVQASCLRSFLHQGHTVVLHCYQRPKDTPDGVEVADAAELLPESRMIRHRKGGSPALFSDLLRYEILAAGRGLYVDCDVFCVRSIEDAEYILGRETEKSIASGVLKLPPDCPVLAALRAIKDTPNFVPPWRKVPPRRLAWLLGAGPAASLEDLKWGTVGPDALTYYAKEHGIDRLASPIDRFYPVHWDHKQLLSDPDLSLKDLTTHRTDAIHLWHNLHQPLFHGSIPIGSPLWEICQT